jgi:hypothetical protein
MTVSVGPCNQSDTREWERRPSAAVLQKKRVIFLGWFHHTTVMLYCWHAFHNCIAPGLWFATMNYLVHSVMYTYYFLMVFQPLRPYARQGWHFSPARYFAVVKTHAFNSTFNR